MPEIKDRLQVSNGALGTTLLIGALGGLAALQLAGKWCARFGSAPVMRVSVLAGAAVFPLVANASSRWAFGALAFLFMFTIATMDIAMNAHAVAIEHESGRLIMGRLHGLWSVGGIAGGLLGGALASVEVSLAGQAMLLATAVAVISITTGPLLLPAEADRHAPSEASHVKHRHPMLFWLLGLVGLCAAIGEGAAIDWGAVLLRDEWQVTPFVASIPYVVFQTAMVIGRFSSDALSQRFGRSKLLYVCGTLTLCGLSAGLLIGDVVGIALGWFLLGLGVSVVIPMVFSAAGAIALQRYNNVIAPSQAVAMVSGVAYAAFLAGPPVIGFVADAMTLRWAMLLPALLGIGVILGARIVKQVD